MLLRSVLTSLTLLIFLTPKSMAQSKRNDSSVVVIFNDSKPRPKKKSFGDENIIKIAPLGIINGTFPIFYERKLTNFLSIQVGGGLTSKNLVRSLVLKDGNSSLKFTYPTLGGSNSYYDEVERLFEFDKRSAGIGYCFSVQPRFYLEDDAPDGSYLGISYEYYRYNFSIPGVSQGATFGELNYNGPTQNEYENISDYMVQFGRQNVYDRLTLDWATGIGIRNAKGIKYVATSAGPNPVESGFATFTQTAFNYQINLRLGYHF